jgi:hypothetical protein
MNYSLFQKAHQPMMQYLKNTKNRVGIHKLATANSSFNKMLSANEKNGLNLEMKFVHLQKGVILRAVLQMAYAYDFRTNHAGPQIQRLGDNETNRYIKLLITALTTYLDNFAASFGFTYSPENIQLFTNWNNNFTTALISDLQVHGTAVYEYLYKYKAVYKQYMNQLGVFTILNSNDNNNLRRQFTLKPNLVKSVYNFNTNNLHALIEKVNVPILGNASTVDTVAPLYAFNRPRDPTDIGGAIRRARNANVRRPPRRRTNNTRMLNTNRARTPNNVRTVPFNPGLNMGRRQQVRRVLNFNNPDYRPEFLRPEFLQFLRQPGVAAAGVNRNQPANITNNRVHPPSTSTNRQYMNIRNSVTMNRKVLEQNLANQGYYNDPENVKFYFPKMVLRERNRKGKGKMYN